MTLWIVTTGNSDVQLDTDENWSDLYDQVRYSDPIENCQKFSDLGEPDDETELFLAPSRVLGLVYGQEEEVYSDLRFPLLEVFADFFKNRSDDSIELPDRILVLLTDQGEIFSNSQTRDSDCPFWQDTCTLEPLFEHYFNEQFSIEPQFVIIQPKSDQEKGIDSWTEMLACVGEALNEQLEQQNCRPDELVYVSHQAGTSAISSAVQFLCVSQFENVKFLVSNQYYDYEEECWQYQPELIQSSSYWRGLQIQKAKKPLKNGFPGSAVELLEGLIEDGKIKEIEKYVDRFNIKSVVGDPSEEFEREHPTFCNK